MKFSILLPTRNRLEYLKYALNSVLMQDYSNWEVIVSDNFSEDDIEGYISSLNEPRIKYFRTASFLPVTDNWNYALSKSSGDYMIMLGDDDALVNQSLDTLAKWIAEYQAPDLIYTSAFLYCYPGVVTGLKGGSVVYHPSSSFLQSTETPFFLEKKVRMDLVNNSMNFHLLFGYNMQFTTFSRELVTLLMQKGEFFQSPYPDYYAMNVLFLKAGRVLACPTPLVIIGICPKSFGCYYFSDREQQGVEFLNNLNEQSISDSLKKVVLPGTKMNTSWLLAMQLIKENYKDEFPELRVNYNRYRWIQILQVFVLYAVDCKKHIQEMSKMWSCMRLRDKIWFSPFLTSIFILIRLVRRSDRPKMAHKLFKVFGRSHKAYCLPPIPGTYNHMGDLLLKISSKKPYVKGEVTAY